MGNGMDLSRGILEATSSLFLVTEVGTGVVVEMNRAAEEMTGFSRQVVVGLPLWGIASPAHRAMLQRALGDPTGEALPSSFESTVKLRSGKPRRIVWSSAFLSDSRDVRTHVVTTGIDTSSDRLQGCAYPRRHDRDHTSSEAASGGLFAHLMMAANTTALVSTDRRGRVTYCSSGAERLLGLDGSQLLGELTPLEMFDPSELRSRAAQLQIFRVSRCWSRRRSPRTVPPGPGELFPHDVTEQRKATRALADALAREEKAVGRLHELDRVKSEFVATLSHELRTPMTNIVGSTEMLLDGLVGDLAALQRELVATVDRNSERLIALADDLVTLARIDARELEMEFSVLDLRDIVSGTQPGRGATSAPGPEAGDDRRAAETGARQG